MEGRRIAASPRPCSGRRIVAARRQRVDASANCVRKLQRPEIGTSGNRAFNITNSQEKFQNFQLQNAEDSANSSWLDGKVGVFYTLPRFRFPEMEALPIVSLLACRLGNSGCPCLAGGVGWKSWVIMAKWIPPPTASQWQGY